MNKFSSINFYLFLLIGFFLASFIYKSLVIMVYTPFYDFDEAHRAENAKRMKEYRSFLVPLTGSPFDRIPKLKTPLKDNPFIHLYYHLERPPLVYLLMVLSISVFGSVEWAYRLPSFILGLSTILLLYLFARNIKSPHPLALIISMVSLIASTDLWLSSQYAQLDTGLTLFLSAAVFFLVAYTYLKQKKLLVFSGMGFALAILAKGQQAVIYLLPVIYLFITKNLKITELTLIFLGAAVLIIPWIGSLTISFHLSDILGVFSGFAITSASILEIHHKAPFYWYIRWWWESFRPGWTIFLSLFIYDYFNKGLSVKKKTLAFFIFSSLFILSIPLNKIWWYTLPLVPAVCFYIFLSVDSFLKNNPRKIPNLLVGLLVASAPLFLTSSNTISLIYGAIVTVLTLFFLYHRPFGYYFSVSNSLRIKLLALVIALLLLPLFFNFPTITPYHWNVRPVAMLYNFFPGRKCLWAKDMPIEAALFYTNAGEISIFNEKSVLPGHCKNYLLSPLEEEDLQDPQLKNKQLLFRVGTMKLYKL